MVTFFLFPKATFTAVFNTRANPADRCYKGYQQAKLCKQLCNYPHRQRYRRPIYKQQQLRGTGNLTKDVKEGITNIEWTVYGKIKKVAKSTGTIEYTYDAAGNRISKTANNKTTVMQLLMQ